MNSQVSITLTEDEAVVLFEFFARFSVTGEFRMCHNSEFVAFMSLSAQLEKSLAAPLQPEYREQLAAAQGRLSHGYEGVAPGVEPLPSDAADA